MPMDGVLDVIQCQWMRFLRLFNANGYASQLWPRSDNPPRAVRRLAPQLRGIAPARAIEPEHNRILG